jgi:hypothetical protein
MNPTGWRILVSAVLVSSAVLFAVGVAIERGSHEQGASHASAVVLLADADHAESGTTPSAAPTGGKPSTAPQHRETSGETSHETPSQRSRETPAQLGHETQSERAHEHNSERVFGINAESIALVVAAVIASVAFAIAIWLSDSILLIASLAAFALLAAAFDIREIVHQIDESKTGLAVIAAVVASLHLLVGASTPMLRRSRLPTGVS